MYTILTALKLVDFE